MEVVFNKPYFIGKELDYIRDSVASGKISGNGLYTKKCHEFFEKKYGFKKALLTSSCTDALEMAAILADIKPGDEVILPSYTFVSTANAFILRGAKLVFVDCEKETPNIDASKIEENITKKTKVIVAVHYAGVACDMDKIMDIANSHNILVIEDAAHSIDSFYKGKPLGSIGHLGAFSFHETKNVICGEGGMLAVNDERFLKRAEIIWEKGTNRAEFFRGEVNKYGWVDIGSSFLPSDIISAFLYAQLEHLEKIQNKRKKIWQTYYEKLSLIQKSGKVKLPYIHTYATNNAHMFYLVCKTPEDRNNLLKYLNDNEINAVFHYLPLHKSKFYEDKYKGKDLLMCNMYSECLLRLPFYYDLTDEEIEFVTEKIKEFYKCVL